jgi:hypothetical protein
MIPSLPTSCPEVSRTEDLLLLDCERARNVPNSRPTPTHVTDTQRIVKEFDGLTALDCDVVEPGPLKVGDIVELLR